jgi:hypothetical protein
MRRIDGAYAPGDTTAATYTEYFLEGSEPAGRGAVLRLLRRARSLLWGW